MAQVIEISPVDQEGPAITLKKDVPIDKPSANFGDGIELLMNEKKKNNAKSDMDLGDLTKLEDELNDLSKEIGEKGPSKSGLFNQALNSAGGAKLNEETIKIVTTDNNKPSLAKNTVEKNDISKIEPSLVDTNVKTKQDNTFGKFNIPLDPDKHVPAAPKLTHEEMVREKFKALRNLESLEKKGVKLSKKYNMESSLTEMQGEYEMIIADKEREASSKFQGRMLMAAVTGLEFLNNRFDPFDVKLDGWAEQMNENMEDYDEIFAELHDKYKSKAKMAPELKLLFQLGGSAIMVHMTNTMFKSAMPGMDDIMRQNPELMQQFTQAAVNSMGESNPGFSGFMNGVMNNDRPGGDVMPNVTPGPPPPPVSTQSLRSQRKESNRPDLTAARGDDGIDITEQFENLQKQDPPTRSAKPKTPRPEMKGPSDISDLLSGLKTKTINVSDKKEGSTISVEDLKEISSKTEPPAGRSKRRQKSDKNIVSLQL